MRPHLITSATLLLTAIAATAINPAGPNIPTHAAPDSTSVGTHHHPNAEEAHTQQLMHSRKVAYFGGEDNKADADSINRLIARFYYDQYRHFQDPEAPYFLMISRDATLAMGIGGAVRMRGWYDFDGDVPYNGFIPYTIAVPGDPARQRRLDATPAGTALFFRILGCNKALGNFSAYIQGNFDGNGGSDFKIKKSYATINDWTIGYATSTFSDITANPPVIDAQGPCGQVNNTAVLLQWRHNMTQRWTMAASFEFPKSYVNVDKVYTETIKDWLPDLTAFGQINWDEGLSHLRLSGLLRALPYRDIVGQKNRTTTAWGAQISGKAVTPSPVTLFWEAVGGAGVESYINDLMIGNNDLFNNPDSPGRMYAPYCMGLTAGVRYDFTNSVFSSVSLSEARMWHRRGAVDPDSYRYGLYCVANVFWNMSARLQIGAEYLYGYRRNRSGQGDDAQRVNMLFQFSF